VILSLALCAAFVIIALRVISVLFLLVNGYIFISSLREVFVCFPEFLGLFVNFVTSSKREILVWTFAVYLSSSSS